MLTLCTRLYSFASLDPDIPQTAASKDLAGRTDDFVWGFSTTSQLAKFAYGTQPCKTSLSSVLMQNRMF